ncbi:hypothetical protein [Quadrisphaera setariae]|uniref:Antimicrobial peptide, SdpC family n=1 Tax=Quadrisphaera setariae TaxID=2593304 RepID=A0A5C8Z2Y3_9ACTN|nr:hypothetical protein [Quadrisphaera setariae]TXR51583.1 hypothetical protein FMM08_22300 [Quadrisphaera setariae]
MSMSKSMKLAAAVGASASLLVASANTALATAPTPDTPTTPPAIITSVSGYSDTNIALLLLTGSGPAAKSHPEVLQKLGWNSVQKKFTQAQANDFVTKFLAATPQFHSAVAVPVQSGDPYAVKGALLAISSELHDFVKPDDAAVSSLQASAAATSAKGSYKTRTNVVTNYQGAVNVAAVVNGGLYANVAVATEVAVAAAFVWLAAVVLTYKFDDSSLSAFDTDELTATVASDLKVS